MTPEKGPKSFGKGKKNKNFKIFNCLIFSCWSTNWGQCQLKLTNQRKSNQILVFEERGKQEYLEENLSVQSREPTNSTHIMTPSLGIEPRPHWWEASALTTAPSRHYFLVVLYYIGQSFSCSGAYYWMLYSRQFTFINQFFALQTSSVHLFGKYTALARVHK